MSNPFDDLKADDTETSESDAAIEAEAETETGSGIETSPEPESQSDSKQLDDESATTETTPSRPTDASTSTAEPSADREAVDDTPDESVSPAETGPAFEYSEVQQKPFYARTETVTEFENQIRTTIVPKLAQAGVLDEESREIHDAILRLANEQPERVAELVLEERRQSGGT
ncbi:hypothetical protein E2L06_16845 [Haloterrigena sp. H1]|uniref:hypothetical protein n=1 Tax=Haloterrigena sp. H1 TaxID=2552943 RepID=UPI00110EDEDE|nr:hypothetical protein [Haloterrigena sp. H1]TMT81608.1 hypothetical protein E2L06_16845 [Haloterrigena sp. H1]